MTAPNVPPDQHREEKVDAANHQEGENIVRTPNGFARVRTLGSSRAGSNRP